MKKSIILIFCLCLCVVTLLAGCSMLVVGSDRPEEFYNHDPNYITYNGHLIHHSGWGLIEVFRSDVRTNGEPIVGKRLGIFLDKIPTHFTMLSLHKGMTLTEVIAACGMPDGTYGSGIHRIYYQTTDGYYYDLYFHSPDEDSTSDYISYEVAEITIVSTDRSGKELSRLRGDEAAAFQWEVRLVYLGIAAILGVVLVVLIKVPNAIRKRKAASQPE